MPAPSLADNYVFLGTHGHVIALDKRDGTLVWETSLPRTGYQVVVMLVEDGKLLCATAGRAFALDPLDGSILWENNLTGRGQGIVALCSMRQSTDSVGAVTAQAAVDEARKRDAND